MPGLGIATGNATFCHSEDELWGESSIDFKYVPSRIVLLILIQ